MPPSRRSSHASADTSASTTTHAASHSALLGASLAFSRSPASLQPTPALVAPPLSAGSNGALAAAASSSPAYRGGSTPLPLTASQPARSDTMKDHVALDMANMPRLPLPQDNRPLRGASPSQQAAVLATARARSDHSEDRSAARQSNTKNFDRPAVAAKPRRLSKHYITASERPTDTTSIAPTTSLVDLYEQRSREAQDAGKKPEPIVIKPTNDLTLKSPKPVRSGITSMFQLELPESKSGQQTDQHIEEGQGRLSEKRQRDKYDGRSSSDDSFASASEDLNTHSNTASPFHALKTENESRRLSAVSPSPVRPPVAKPIPTRSPQGQRGPFGGSIVDKAVTKPIPIKPPPRPATAPHDTLSASSSRSLKTIPAQFHQAYPRRMTPLTTGDDLANALVASSLASSRAASPTRLDLPSSSHKKKNQHHSMLSFSRTPSPAKGGMLHTLRKTDSSSESEDDHHPYGKHKKKRLVRKHPNKHHEGDRKRWRDAVTERERKRYEGVWAANKGLHYSFTYDEQEIFQHAPMHERALQIKAIVNEQISNLVAREIWNRSRLPESILEVVWDLVDNNNVGRLQKEEFVVGMWLIDQRLKGRKLPVKVSETVWSSVRGIHGIKVKKK